MAEANLLTDFREPIVQDDFSKYEAMKQSGASPEVVYWVAERDGMDNITMFRLIRSVFSLELTEAKQIIIRAKGWANSLEEYEDRIADILEKHHEKSPGKSQE